MTRISLVRRAAIAAAAVLIAGATVGCAGSGSPKSTTVPSNAGSRSSSGAQPPDDAAIAKEQTSGGVAPAGAGAPAAASDGSAQAGAAPQALQVDRKIIQVATVSLYTQDVAAAFENISTIATGAGGFVSGSQFGPSGDAQTAAVTIRVPADRYQDALNSIRRLGDVRSVNSSTNDVTGDYTDLQSRLRNLKATEAQYLEFLGRAQNIGEVLQVQDRLNTNRGEIEQVQGRITLLERQTDLATITAQLAPPPANAGDKKPDTGNSGPLETARNSFQASLTVLTAIATAGLAVAAFSWWFIPLAIAGWYVGRRTLRRAQAP